MDNKGIGMIDHFKSLIGAANVITEPSEKAPYEREWRDKYVGKAACVLRPANTSEVSAILSYANAHAIKIVPQGGNTGLVGGGVPFATGDEVVLSLSRLNTIRAIDPNGNTITVEAGCILQNVQQAADQVDRLFPLSLGAEGSCQIGGNLSTNAGGTAVLAYGNARALVLGLEVVLADGRIWHGLKALRKDNTGYDLKNLFMGAEGTLGIITAAVLKLFPKPKAQDVAFVGLKSPEAALELFNLVQGAAGSMLTGFELMPRLGLEFVLRHADNARDPLETPHPWYALVELSSGIAGTATRDILENELMAAIENDIAQDAAIAENSTQAQAFWHMRHMMSEVQKAEGGSIKHDISVPVGLVPAFLTQATAMVLAMVPDCRPVPFGHLGDGNIHFNISQPLNMDTAEFLSQWEAMNDMVHNLVLEMGGSISAEHGIGRMKRAKMAQSKDPVELELMHTLKAALDPKNILNPGKVI
jgi:FAD/FMN-containing dehydrogenase